jgi:hypothetical protein
VAERVDSVGQPSFASVVVPAGGSREVLFRRTGVYRYEVPRGGARKGQIVVVAGARRPRPRGSAGSCNRRRVFLYDVTVTGSKSATETWLPQFLTDGEFTLSYRYVVRYPGLAVVVDSNCGTRITSVNARGSGTGTLQPYSWSDRVVRRGGGTEQPCGFMVSATGLGATIRINTTFVAQGGGSSIVVLSRLTESQGNALADLLGARRDAQCDKGGLSNARVFDGLPGHGTVPIFGSPYSVAGVRVSPPLTVLNGEFFASGRGVPSPLRRLLQGASFTVNSGVKRYDGTSSQTHAIASASVKIEFRRRR